MATISVDVDVDDIILDISTKRLRTELQRRNAEGEDEAAPTVRDAINQMRRGDVLDAITTLEREFFQKWRSTAECSKQHQAALGGV